MRHKITTLTGIDILILTIIMFSYGIYTSSLYYLTLLQTTETGMINANTFSAEDNTYAFMLQSLLLFLAFLYLKWRKFDFKIWHCTPSLNGIGSGLFIFIVTALCLDSYFLLWDLFNPSPYSLEESAVEMAEYFEGFNLPLIPYALLNGFYEEIFFLGICLSVKPRSLPLSFIYSLVIRFSFHTYQGIEVAFGISLIVGTLFFLFYRFSKHNRLFPFFIAHALGDVFGMGILSYLF
ncbi:type II CAAX prenyl endopeptidase Rce1 family protein [Pasteurella sp. PK-2025]|uniref:CPBP family glutamic-type intramembrane protease n=1 Tax=unclassified Pasteurella TaxID=2621516 RepID=UPI003C7083AB